MHFDATNSPTPISSVKTEVEDGALVSKCRFETSAANNPANERQI